MNHQYFLFVLEECSEMYTVGFIWILSWPSCVYLGLWLYIWVYGFIGILSWPSCVICHRNNYSKYAISQPLALVPSLICHYRCISYAGDYELRLHHQLNWLLKGTIEFDSSCRITSLQCGSVSTASPKRVLAILLAFKVSL